MKPISEIRQELFDAIPLGIDIAIESIKQHLPVGSVKYGDILLLEGRYKDNKLKLLKGTASEKDIEIIFNQIREALVDFATELSEQDFQIVDPKTEDRKARKKARRGNVLYRIPGKMQVRQEVKCLVRLAFDKESLMLGLEKVKEDKIGDVRISEVMGAELIDPSQNKAFAIRSYSETVQFVDEGDYTEWLFYVQPLLEGTHPLLLKISIIELVRGKERKKEVVLEQTIQIVADPVPEGDEKILKPAGLQLSIAGAVVGQKEEIEIPISDALDRKRSRGESAPSPAPAAPSQLPPKVPTTPAAPPQGKDSNNRFRVFIIAGILIALLLVWWFNSRNARLQSEQARTSWERIQASTDTTDFLQFLADYPNSKFRTEAFEKLETLRLTVVSSDAEPSLDIPTIVIDQADETDGDTTAETEAESTPTTTDSENTSSGEEEGVTPDTAEPTGQPTIDQNENDPTNETEPTSNPPLSEPTPSDEEISSTNTDTAPTDEEAAAIKERTGDAVDYLDLRRRPIYRGCNEDDEPQISKACLQEKLARHIRNSLRCNPSDLVNVKVRFIIDAKGRVSDAFLVGGSNSDCAEVAIRTLRNLPRFKPGLNEKGEPIEAYYDQPIVVKPRKN